MDDGRGLISTVVGLLPVLYVNRFATSIPWGHTVEPLEELRTENYAGSTHWLVTGFRANVNALGCGNQTARWRGPVRAARVPFRSGRSLRILRDRRVLEMKHPPGSGRPSKWWYFVLLTNRARLNTRPEHNVVRVQRSTGPTTLPVVDSLHQ